MNKKNKEVLEILYRTHPDAKCELQHETPLQLLIATILSAQATDKKVNEVTEKMFQKYKTLEDFLQMTMEELESYIKVIGLYRSKGSNLMKLFPILKEKHGGEVPRTMEELVLLPGVGRKTANVVLSNAYGVPAIAVDTHVFRVANRIGIVKEETVEKTEESLMKKLDKNLWIDAHHLLIFHGRRICTARSPQCGACPLNHLCTYYKKNKKTLMPKEK
ncbi:endonuclease III [Proteiniclasticum ruminis]|uniref:Endonuclease III n=1 Tax=Proteiniclasticum ruminis TaxID=398199 RepID=A0A1I4Z1T3_9CLOT|nr:endonuclease III [Proteiniclasticum ruminis]SFN44127.1 DNA-(apurinic or apyrimidinic site) lyase /endonuclease III [Proteiniclasticum ruminis]